MYNSKSLLEKIFTILLISYPLLSVYKSPISSVNLPNLFMVGILFFLIITKKVKAQLSKSSVVIFLYIFAFSSLFFALISSLITQENNLVSIFGRFSLLVLYIFILSVSREVLDLNLAVKLVRKISVFASILLIVQITTYYTLHLNIHFFIPYLPLNDGMVKSLNNLIYDNYSGKVIYRPMTIFGEPSHFAYYIGMALAVLLFIDKDIKKKTKLLFGTLYSIALLLSTSGAGAYLMAITWIIHLMSNKEKKTINTFLVVFFCSVLTLFFSIINNTSVDYFSYAFSRLNTSSSRIFSFLNYIKEMDFGLQIIGSGMGNSSIYFKEINEDTVSSFMSSFGRILVESGFIGLLLFLVILINLYKTTHKKMRVFVYIFILGCLIESTVFSIYLSLYLLWPLAFSKNSKLYESESKMKSSKVSSVNSILEN